MFNLQKLRTEKKLKQSDIADLLGCKQSNISAIENNGKNPTDEQLQILINNFGEEYIMSLFEETQSQTSEFNSMLEIMKLQADSINKKDDQLSKLITIIENQLKK